MICTKSSVETIPIAKSQRPQLVRQHMSPLSLLGTSYICWVIVASIRDGTATLWPTPMILGAISASLWGLRSSSYPVKRSECFKVPSYTSGNLPCPWNTNSNESETFTPEPTLPEPRSYHPSSQPPKIKVLITLTYMSRPPHMIWFHHQTIQLYH